MMNTLPRFVIPGQMNGNSWFRRLLGTRCAKVTQRERKRRTDQVGLPASVA